MSEPTPPRMNKITKLNNTKFHTWEQELLSELSFHNLEKYILSDHPRPTVEAELTKYNREIRWVTAFIRGAVELQFIPIVDEYRRTPWTLYYYLNTQAVNTTTANKGKLEVELYSNKANDFPDIESYIEAQIKLLHSLTMLGQIRDTSSRINVLLAGLPSEYNTLRLILEAQTEKTFESVTHSIKMFHKDNIKTKHTS